MAARQSIAGCFSIGVELPNEWIFPVIKQRGRVLLTRPTIPEVDLIAAKQMIHETIERRDLTDDEKAKVLGLNAKRVFRV